jgi:hypothetical protein
MSPGLNAMVSAVARVDFSSFLKLMFSGTFTVIKGVVGSLMRTGISKDWRSSGFLMPSPSRNSLKRSM